GERTGYLLLDETDLVTGRYLKKIVAAAQNLVDEYSPRPEVLILCSTCVDALLGTDMERLARETEEACGLPVLATTMYALTREGTLPPMVSVRQSLYSLLTKKPKNPRVVNLLGFFTHLHDNCELYPLLQSLGITTIHELGRKTSLSSYQEMACANFNLVLHPEARVAARFLAEKYEIPFIELTRSFELEKIKKQYQLLGQILETPIDDTPYYTKAKEVLDENLKLLQGETIAIGETSNAEPFDLALSLVRLGVQVSEIFAEVSPAKLPLLKALAKLSPKTRIYSNLSPSMLFFKENTNVTFAIASDACHYYPHCPGIPFAEQSQPFGYQGLTSLILQIKAALKKEPQTKLSPKTSENSSKIKKAKFSKHPAPKGFLSRLTPLAPDQSGVVSALYELGGMLVILDAGGCTGNLCGFDEPRWTKKPAMLFSAGLRDMDAILGRDQKLIEKTIEAQATLKPKFIALIGTPVPCVIGTDLRGLAKILEKKCQIPVLPFETTGTKFYDVGLSEAYCSLFQTFATE
ncbi:MAG: hypothetical protein IJS50_04630, partial [Desulfovibrio sp.]|nr:hypothetical protein [Desulfovibrio sp.]